MSIKELAFHQTPLGALTLLRRNEPRLQNIEVFEVKLGDDYLMSSLFTEGEVQLSDLGLAGLEGKLDVVVGGLGLGYTAVAALAHENVASLLVVEAFEEVINWHKNGLVPMGKRLSDSEQCIFVQGDFFKLSRTGFDPANTQRKFDAVLLDIDHSPKHYLDPTNASFYAADGLQSVRRQIKPNGVFALWSDDAPDEDFRNHLSAVFGTAIAIPIEFPNPYTGGRSVNTVYNARNSLA